MKKTQRAFMLSVFVILSLALLFSAALAADNLIRRSASPIITPQPIKPTGQPATKPTCPLLKLSTDNSLPLRIPLCTPYKVKFTASGGTTPYNYRFKDSLTQRQCTAKAVCSGIPCSTNLNPQTGEATFTADRLMGGIVCSNILTVQATDSCPGNTAEFDPGLVSFGFGPVPEDKVTFSFSPPSCVKPNQRITIPVNIRNCAPCGLPAGWSLQYMLGSSGWANAALLPSDVGCVGATVNASILSPQTSGTFQLQFNITSSESGKKNLSNTASIRVDATCAQ